MTQRGYGDSAAHADAPCEDADQRALSRRADASIAGVQGSTGEDRQSPYRAGSTEGGAASGQAATTGGTGGYGGGDFDPVDPPQSGQVAHEQRTFHQAEGVTPQRGADEAVEGLNGPKGDPAEGSRDR